MEYIRICLGAFENSVAPSRLRIFQYIVGEREKLWIELVRVLLRRSDGPGKFVVQKQSSAARHVRGNRIEDFSVHLVFVESVVDIISEESSALRAAPAVGIADAGGFLPRRQRVRSSSAVFHLVSQERNQITNDGETESQYQRILRRIDKLVNVAGFEA